MPSSQLREIVVVGGGVAGTRAAETLRQDGYDGALTIVGAERHAPYHRPPLSKKLLTGKVHRAGVDLAPQFELDARVLRGASALKLDMSSRTVHLRDDDRELSLQFDGLVIASGAVARGWPGGPGPDGNLLPRPARDWLGGSGLRVDDGVVCDATGIAEGSTADVPVVAAGDVARWWHPLYERHLRTEHWEDAGRQGAAAARTLLAGPDRAEAYDDLPYFWSDQYDVKVQMLGVPSDYDKIDIVEGDPRAWEFVAAYGRGGRTVAVLGTIPNRVYAYRDTIAKGAQFPPNRPD